MRLLFYLWVLLINTNFAFSGDSISEVFLELQKSKTGKELYLKYLNSENIHISFSEGVSRTESTLRRSLDPLTGKEVNSRDVNIYISSPLSIIEKTLDLSHELTHALYEPTWSPYDPDLSVDRFIVTSIESLGGEAHAIESECNVALDFINSHQIQFLEKEQLKKRCSAFYSLDFKKVEYKKLLDEIYKVGSDLDVHNKEVFNVIPHISYEKPSLYSSVADLPYPLALMIEYEQLTRVACRNTVKRVQSSSRPDQLHEEKYFIKKRCK